MFLYERSHNTNVNNHLSFVSESNMHFMQAWINRSHMAKEIISRSKDYRDTCLSQDFCTVQSPRDDKSLELTIKLFCIAVTSVYGDFVFRIT